MRSKAQDILDLILTHLTFDERQVYLDFLKIKNVKMYLLVLNVWDNNL